MRAARVSLNDSVKDIVIKMSDMNPGAIGVMMNIMNDTESIDQDCLIGGFGVIMTLDTLQIYGSDIWVLYSDICGKSMSKMIAVLRAVQLGLFSGETLRDAASRQDYSGKKMVPVEEIALKVKERLPNFNLLYAENQERHRRVAMERRKTETPMRNDNGRKYKH